MFLGLVFPFLLVQTISKPDLPLLYSFKFLAFSSLNHPLTVEFPDCIYFGICHFCLKHFLDLAEQSPSI